VIGGAGGLLRIPISKGLHRLHPGRRAHSFYAGKGVTFPPPYEILNPLDVVFTFPTFCSAK